MTLLGLIWLSMEADGEAVRVAAMHALANLVGGARVAQPPETPRAGDVQLCGEAEEALQNLVYGAAGAQTPGEVLWGAIRQPFQDLRFAAFRFLLRMGHLCRTISKGPFK